MSIDLTLCVATIPARRSLLTRCLWSLTNVPGAEILVIGGDRPIGDKLNEMFEAARGTYVVAIDDDDYLGNYTVPAAVAAGDTKPDFIGYDIVWMEDGRFSGLVKHSLDGDPGWDSLDRGVSPKCPVRTEIARSVPFGNEYVADRLWSQSVFAQCRSGEYVPTPSYIYDHWNAHMVGTYPQDPRYGRPQRDVGIWPYDESRVTWLG